MKKKLSSRLGAQYSIDVPPVSVNEMAVFQFEIKDRQKVYGHARNAGLKIHMYKTSRFMVGYYIPPKKMTPKGVTLDFSYTKAFVFFCDSLRRLSIRHHMVIYKQADIVSFGYNK